MAELQAIVGGRIFVPAGVLSRSAERELRGRLTFEIPGWKQHNGKPKVITAIADAPDGFYLPRGSGYMLDMVAEDDGLRVVYRDETAPGAALDVAHKLPGGAKLHIHQRRAVRALVRHGNGMAVFPCGGGKTVVGLAGIAALKRSTAVLVHTRDLLDQWRAAIKSQLGVDAVKAGSSLVAGPITVAMIQGLTGRSHSAVARWSRNFGLVVLDECHHAPAATFRTVLGCMVCRYRWGLTATPERSDGLGFLARAVLGPLLYEGTVQDLVDVGRLVLPEITRVDTWLRYPGAQDYSGLLAAIEKDDVRSRAIVDRVGRHVREGRKVILLTLRVGHCNTLAELARGAGITAEALHGKVLKSRRPAVLERFKSGTSSVLVGTKVADEGLDVPSADALVLAMPSRAAGAAAQRTGRVIRAAKGKTAVVDDVVDAHRIARQHWYRRKREYRDRYGDASLQEPVSLLQRGGGLAHGT